MGEIDHVAKDLAKWASDEMGFRFHKNQAEDKKPIDLTGICLGPLSDIWVYVMKHVRNESTIQMIKGNLLINSPAQHTDPQFIALINERDKLKKEIMDLKKSIDILSNSKIETKVSIGKKEKELENQKLGIRDLKRSSFLLETAKKHIEENVKSMNQSTAEVEKQLHALIPRIESEVEIERYKIDVKNMCHLMQNSLNELLNEEPNFDKMNETKISVGSKLATLLEVLPHPFFMKLIQEQQATEISLMAQKSALNPQFKEAIDFVPEHVQPLQKLLYELSWYYASIRTRAKIAKNKTKTLREELTEMKLQTIQRLKLYFEGDDEKLADALLLLDMEIQVASKKVAVDALRKNLEDLDNFCKSYEARHTELEEKITAIEKNSRLSDHLTTLICTLARKRVSNPGVVQQLITQCQQKIKDDLKAVNLSLKDRIEASKSNVDKELELFRHLRPSQLFNVKIEKKCLPINRLTIYRFYPTSGSSVSEAHLQMVLNHLNLPRTLPVFRLLEAVGERRLQMLNAQQAVKWHEARKSEVAEKYGLVWLENGLIRYKELARKLEENWNSQEKALLPSLDLRRKRMDEAVKCVIDIEGTLREWCDEPAKLIDTGRIVNEQTLEQWSAVWKKSLNFCRKKN